MTVNASNTVVLVRGFRFSGAVNVNQAVSGSPITTLENCRLDGGFNSGGDPLDKAIHLRGCLIFGNARVYAYWTDVTGNTVVGGTLTVHSNGGSGAYARDNLVLGPASPGLTLPSTDSGGSTGSSPTPAS